MYVWKKLGTKFVIICVLSILQDDVEFFTINNTKHVSVNWILESVCIGIFIDIIIIILIGSNNSNNYYYIGIVITNDIG